MHHDKKAVNAAHTQSEINDHSHIFGELLHEENGRRTMARNNRVTLGLFMAAALSAFGGLGTVTTAFGGDYNYIWAGKDENDAPSTEWYVGHKTFENRTGTALSWSNDDVTTDTHRNVEFKKSTEGTVNIGQSGASEPAPVNVNNMEVVGNYTFTGGAITSNRPGGSLTVGDVDNTSTNVTFDNKIYFDGSAKVLGNGTKVQFKNDFNIGQGVLITEEAELSVDSSSSIDGNDTYFTGDGTIVKSGTGTLILTSAENKNFSGKVNVNAGVLQLDGAQFSGVDKLTIGTSASVALESDAAIRNLAGSGSITVNDGSLIVLGDVTSDGTEYTGIISGQGGVTIGDGSSSGVGDAKFNQLHTYTGATVINDGSKLTLTNGNAIQASSGLSLNNATFDITGVTTIGASATIQALSGDASSEVHLGGKNLILAKSGDPASLGTYAGKIIGGDDGKLTISSANSTDTFSLTGIADVKAVDITKGKLELSGDGKFTDKNPDMKIGAAGTLALSGASDVTLNSLTDVSGANVAMGDRNLTVLNASATSAKTVEYNSVFSSNGTSSKISLGTNNAEETFTFSGVSTDYKGSIDVADGNTLKLDANAFANAKEVNLLYVDSAASKGGKLSLGHSTELNKVTGAANSQINLGSSTLTMKGTETSDFKGVINGTGNLAVNSGNVILSQKQTYTGNTTVSGGTLSMSGDGRLYGNGFASGNALKLNGGTFDVSGVNGTVYNMKHDLDTQAGSVIALGEVNKTLEFHNAANVAGNITGNGNVAVKNGTNVVFSGNKEYTGTTTVESGKLTMNGGTLASSSITVNSGGTFDAYGNAKNVTVNGGTLVNNVNSNGTLNVDNFTLTNNGVVNLTTSDGKTSVNASDKVILESGKVNITAASSGVYTIFKGNSVTNSLTNSDINVNSGSSAFFLEDTGTEIKVWAYKDGQIMQVYSGDDGVWNTNTDSWKTVDPTTGELSLPGKWAGHVAIFRNDGHEVIEVGNNVGFNTLQVASESGDRTFTGGNLNLSKDSSGKAYITVTDASDAGNKTATFKSALKETTSGTNLVVGGGGKVIFDNADNRYSGGTTIDGRTTLQFNYENTGITGTMAMNGNGTLILNYDGRFSNQITGTIGSTVAIAGSGNKILLDRDNSGFLGQMVVGDGATLEANVANALGSTSNTLELGDGSTLIVNRNQTIYGLAANHNSAINLASGSLTLNSADNTVFNGSLVGTGNFKTIGSGTTTIGYLDTSRYEGAFNVTNGTLELNGIGDRMVLNVESGMANGSGKYVVAAEKDLVVTGGNLNGRELEVRSGSMALDSGSQKVVKSGTLTLSSSVGGKSNLVIDDKYAIGKLNLNGGDLHFINGATNTEYGPTLTVDKLTVTSSTNVYVDAESLGFNTSNNSFFDMDKGTARDYLVQDISANASGSGNNITMLDANGNSLKEENAYAIKQGGVNNGSAYLKVDSGMDNKGIYFSQQLTKIESFGGTPNVEISSTPQTASTKPASAGNLNRSTIGGAETLNADLFGAGGFTFTGNKSINLKGDNSYQGETLVAMDDGKTVYAGKDNAFGQTSKLNIQSGNVNLNGKGITAGSVAGEAGTILNMAGGNLALNAPSSVAASEYRGDVIGAGNISKTGPGTQMFLGNNSMAGNLSLDGGTMYWAGNLVKSGAGLGNVNVASGVFRQVDSTIGGDVLVSGANSALEGYGRINGNLVVNDGGTYRVTTESGGLDRTVVDGSATFGQNTSFAFSNEAKSYMVANPHASLDVLQTGQGLNLGNSPWANGVIDIDLGILGIATITSDGSSLSYQGITAAGDPIGSITNSWRNTHGLDVSHVLERSNIADVTRQTITQYLWSDRSQVKTNRVANARYANSEFLGHIFQSNFGVSRTEALSVFNYDSGYTTTLPVQAAMATQRSFVGQGLKNRINNLRAARTILSTPMYGVAQGFGGYGYAQPLGAYASTIVQDTFGYNSGYLGAAYYSPYTGTASSYACAPQATSYAPAMAYAAPASDNGMNVWAGGVGNWNKQKTSDGGIGGYTYDAGGLMVGADYISGPVVLGAAFGYSRGKLEDEESIRSDTKIDAYSVNLYADYNHQSGVNAMLFGGYTWLDNKIDRTVGGYRDNDGVLYSDFGTEKHKYHSRAWNVGTSVGYDIIPNSRLTVTPSVGVEWYQAEGKAHTRELRRNSGIVLRDQVEVMRGRSLTAPVDVTATYDVIRNQNTKLSVMGNVGYAYEFMNKGVKGDLRWLDVGNAQTINVLGREPGRNGFNAGVGARFQKNCMSFDVKYDFSKRKDDTSHRVAANVGWSF